MKQIVSLLLAVFVLIGSVSAASSKEIRPPRAVADAAIVLADDWRVLTDKHNVGEQELWYQIFPEQAPQVSLPYDAGEEGSTAWFFRKFTPDLNLESGQRVVADFVGCQYYAKIWLNGNYIGDHEGSYGKFSFDVTDFLREDQPNLLAVRLFSANDGSTIRGQESDTLPQGPTNGQAMQMPVCLSVVPQIAIADIFVDTEYENGNVNVQVIVDNPGTETVKVDIRARISPSGSAAVLTTTGAVFNAVPGLSKHTVTMSLDDFRAWSPDDPYRYTVWVEAFAQEADFSDSSVLEVGFKDLRIDSQGYFMLNGERLYVKSINIPTVTDALREQLMYYKSCGVNMVRFVGGPAPADALALCDTIGLLVYEETAMANKADSVYGEDLIRREIRQLIERDRNHPSFAIVGILNETKDTHTDFVNNYQAAVESLDVVRIYDKDLLVFLSSGRFDEDAATASASNPNALAWDAYLGNEGVTAQKQEMATGDLHGEVPSRDEPPRRAVFVSDAEVSMLDDIRANSKVSGYSLTLDADTDLIGLDGLRDTCWCITMGTHTAYNTDILPISVYLSALGTLDQEEYTARLTLDREGETVWQQDVNVTPARTKTGSYLPSVLVYDQPIPLTGLAADQYRLRAQLLDTDVARDYDLYVADAKDRPAVSGTVYVQGLDSTALSVLNESGLQVKMLDVRQIVPGSTIVLGGQNLPADTLGAVYAAVEQTGATLVCADIRALGDWGYLKLPFAEKAYVRSSVEQTLDLPAVVGLPAAWDVDAALQLDRPARMVLRGSQDAPVAGVYDYGLGTIVLQTPIHAENIGTPVADHLFLQLVDYALREC